MRGVSEIAMTLWTGTIRTMIKKILLDNAEFVFVVVVISLACTWVVICLMAAVSNVIDKYFDSRLRYLGRAYELPDDGNGPSQQHNAA